MWLLWFFFATITLFETGKIDEISPVGVVRSQFSAEAAERVRVGQPAWVNLDDDALGLISAIVIHRHKLANGMVEVEAQILDESFFAAEMIPPTSDEDEKVLSGQFQIEVEQISPARLLLRSSGQFADAPSVAVTGANNR